MRLSDQLDAGALLVAAKRPTLNFRGGKTFNDSGTCASCGSQCGECGNSNSSSTIRKRLARVSSD